MKMNGYHYAHLRIPNVFIQHETERWNPVLLPTIKSGPGTVLTFYFPRNL
jgi:hypothetical protein